MSIQTNDRRQILRDNTEDISRLIEQTDRLQDQTVKFKNTASRSNKNNNERIKTTLKVASAVLATLVVIGIVVILAQHFNAVNTVQNYCANITVQKGVFHIALPVVGLTLTGAAIYQTIAYCRGKEREKQREAFCEATKTGYEQADRLNRTE